MSCIELHAFQACLQQLVVLCENGICLYNLRHLFVGFKNNIFKKPENTDLVYVFLCDDSFDIYIYIELL